MRLGHVTLIVSDIPRARDFYLRLGLTPIVDEAHYCRFLTAGDATLSIMTHEGEAPAAPATEIGLEFESAEALDAEVARLRAAGFVFEEGPVDRSWLWREAPLRDPDGHKLLLFFAGRNKLNPPWRV